ESGLREAMVSEQSFLENSPFSAMRYGGWPWLSQLRMGWDDLGYGWQRWVLSYQADQQQGLWQRWFGERHGMLPGLILAGGVILLLSLLTAVLLRASRAPLDPLQRQFRRFERLLARHGLQRAAGEGPQAFACRAALALPVHAQAIDAFTSTFIAQRYAREPLDLQVLRMQLQRLRRALPWRFSDPLRQD